MSAQRYALLIKPARAPPARLFGPVRTILYIFIAISFGAVLRLARTRRIPRRLLRPFLANLAANLTFSPVQFLLQNNSLAAINILLVLGTLIRATIAIRPHRRRIARFQIPYLLRVIFATALQLSITILNR